MSVARLDTGFNVTVEFAIAPFHKRAIARIIDWAVVLLYIYFVNLLLSSIVGRNWTSMHPVLYVIIEWIPMALYSLIMEISMNGQSIGKKAMAIKVITLEGGQPTLSQYLIRWIFRTVDFFWWAVFINPFLIFFVFAGLICVIVTPYSQRIGDLVAGTILIDLKARTSWQDTIFTAIEENYKPTFPQVMKLSDRDINTIKQIINSVKRSNDISYAASVAAKIQHALDIQTEMHSLEFLETLMKDYNYYTSR